MILSQKTALSSPKKQYNVNFEDDKMRYIQHKTYPTKPYNFHPFPYKSANSLIHQRRTTFSSVSQTKTTEPTQQMEGSLTRRGLNSSKYMYRLQRQQDPFIENKSRNCFETDQKKQQSKRLSNQIDKMVLNVKCDAYSSDFKDKVQGYFLNSEQIEDGIKINTASSQGKPANQDISKATLSIINGFPQQPIPFNKSNGIIRSESLKKIHSKQISSDSQNTFLFSQYQSSKLQNSIIKSYQQQIQRYKEYNRNRIQAHQDNSKGVQMQLLQEHIKPSYQKDNLQQIKIIDSIASSYSLNEAFRGINTSMTVSKVQGDDQDFFKYNTEANQFENIDFNNKRRSLDNEILIAKSIVQGSKDISQYKYRQHTQSSSDKMQTGFTYRPSTAQAVKKHSQDLCILNTTTMHAKKRGTLGDIFNNTQRKLKRNESESSLIKTSNNFWNDNMRRNSSIIEHELTQSTAYMNDLTQNRHLSNPHSQLVHNEHAFRNTQNAKIKLVLSDKLNRRIASNTTGKGSGKTVFVESQTFDRFPSSLKTQTRRDPIQKTLICKTIQENMYYPIMIVGRTNGGQVKKMNECLVKKPIEPSIINDNPLNECFVKKMSDSPVKKGLESLSGGESEVKKPNSDSQKITSVCEYKYIVNYGNNSTLVKRVMETRENWECMQTYSRICNFRWCPTSERVKFDQIGQGAKQMVNHHEFHEELTSKFTLVKNLLVYCETNNLNLFEITPLSFLIDLDHENCHSTLQKFAKFFNKNKPNNPKQSIKEFCKQLKPIMSKCILLKGNRKSHPCTKPRMHKSLINGDNYFWFLKPTGTNRGRGIYIFNTLQELEKYILDYQVGIEDKPIKQQKNYSEKVTQTTAQIKDLENTFSNKNITNTSQEQQKCAPQSLPETQQIDSNQTTSTQSNELFPLIKCRQFVVQKYVERPMLINKRKFDIRAWVLVTHTMDVYFFKESVIRTSCEQFNLDSNQINNQFVHLTNNAVQRFADNYGEFENGNQLSLAQFFAYCHDKYPDCDTGKLHQDMKNIVVHTMNSVKRKINSEDRKYTFELYGYDFLLDDKYNVWLLEINTNPCLDESSPHLQQALPRLLDDIFKLTLDIIFPKTKILSTKQKEDNKSEELKDSMLIKNATLQQTEKEETEEDPEILQSQRSMKQSIQQISFDPSAQITSIKSSNFKEESDKSLASGSSTCYGIKSAITTEVQTHLTEQESQNLIKSMVIEKQASYLASQNEVSPSKLKPLSNPKIVKQSQPQRLNPKKETNWPVDGHPDNENMWELLCSIYSPKPKTPHQSKKAAF